MKHYLENIDEVCRDVKTGVDGITSQEAESRLESNGKNKLAEGKKEPIILRLLKQFIEPMTLILIVAAIISGILTAVNNSSGGKKEFPSDVIIIMAVVIINAVLGVVQESKAEKAIDALQKIAAATSKVIRDGKLVVVKSEDLVVGDVIVLEAGDAVPADARIIECASMKAEEAALTGESVPVLKTSDAISAQSGEVPLGDRKKHGIYGQHRRLRQRQGGCRRNGYGHRNGQNRDRAHSGKGKQNAPSTKAFATQQGAYVSRNRHLRGDFCGQYDSRRRHRNA